MRALRLCVAALFASLVALACVCLPVKPVEGKAAAQGKESAPAAPTPQPRVVEILFHNTLQPVSAASFQRSLDAANRMHPSAILVDLGSPGGLASSARVMAEAIRRSPAPVIVYVREPRTKVAGEALLLLNAGAVSAMHPDSMLLLSRAASIWTWHSHEPLAPQDLWPRLQAQQAAKGRTTPISTTSLAWDRGLTAASAVHAGVVDVVASNEERLLNSVQGREVLANGQPVQLDVQNFLLYRMPLSQTDHLMRAVMNPDLTVLLLTLGWLLIYLEINTPGGVVPGAVGLLLVLLSIYALHNMPLRWQGIVLLLVSIAMLFAETYFEKGSAFGIGSVLCLVLGLRLLVRGPIPELEVDWSTAIGAGVGFGSITAGLLLLGVRAKRAKVKIGAEALVGWLGVVQTQLAPAGQVLVRGELWNARLSSDKTSVAVGECVTVQHFEDKVLLVAPLPSPGNTA